MSILVSRLAFFSGRPYLICYDKPEKFFSLLFCDHGQFGKSADAAEHHRFAA